MGYSVKVRFAQSDSIEVSGDDIAMVVRLLNAATVKFFSTNPSAKIQI